MALIPLMSRSSIYVMTDIPSGNLKVEFDAAQLVCQVVRYNQVIVGCVNSKRRHFERTLSHLSRLDPRFCALLGEMVTLRVPFQDCEKAFTNDDPNQIKTVVEMDPR